MDGGRPSRCRPQTRRPDRVTGNGIVGCAPYFVSPNHYGDFASRGASVKASNAINDSLNPATELVSYQQAAVDFSSFQAATDWRPRAGASIAGSPSNEGPGDWGLTPAQLNAMPALGLDLAGVTRPAQWARGAYEP